MSSWKALRGESSPGANDGETEAQFRQHHAYLYEQESTGKAKTGVLAGCEVTATTPSASGSVQVAIGEGICQPTTNGGVYPIPVTTGNLDIFTANPMQFVANPRNDIVILDQTDGQVKALIGTPNATPSLGEQTVPTTAVPLARLRHLAGATTIPSTAIDDLKVPVSLAHDTTKLTVTSSMQGGKRVHKQAYAGGTTDANGFLTINHTAGFTPTLVQVTSTNPGSSFAVFWGSDTYTSTQTRTRWADPRSTAPSSGAYASSATGSFVAIFWE